MPKNRRLRGVEPHADGAAQRRVTGADLCLSAPRRFDPELLPFGMPPGPPRAHVREDGRGQAAGDQELDVPASGRAGPRPRDRSGFHARAHAEGGRLALAVKKRTSSVEGRGLAPHLAVSSASPKPARRALGCALVLLWDT